jgi:hypothetical protein
MPQHFMKPITEKKLMTPKQITLIFSNLEEILQLNVVRTNELIVDPFKHRIYWKNSKRHETLIPLIHTSAAFSLIWFGKDMQRH